MARSATSIISIFGQIERVVAQAMVDEGKATKIEAGDIPASARFNKHGTEASFAVVLPQAYATELERRIRRLRA